jgi:hypothetical protein
VCLRSLAVTCIRQEPIIIVEESDLFNGAVMRDIFEQKYVIHDLVLNSHDFGFAGARRRYWAVLFHREYVCEVFSSLKAVLPIFTRRCAHSWHVFFCAEHEPSLQAELEQEVIWAAGRPTSLAKNLTKDEVLALPSKRRYLSVMTANENKWVTENARLWPGSCSMANQNSETDRGVCSKFHSFLYCIIRNPTLHYSDAHKRWMSGLETLCANGIPILPRLADPLGVPARCSSFCVGFPSAVPDSVRTRKRKVQSSGNTMNPAIAGFCLIFSLLWSRRTDESLFMRVSKLVGQANTP